MPNELYMVILAEVTDEGAVDKITNRWPAS